MDFLEKVAVFYRDGGAFMHFILIVSVFGLAIVVERFYVLLIKFSMDGKALWDKVSRHIQEGEMGKAAAVCRGSHVPLLRILDTGISASSRTEREIQNAIDEVSMEIIPTIDKRIPYLLTLANISTLLGLLGTIQGLIQAFFAVGVADPSQKATLLASGIAIALYTTFFGLMVAIPMLAAYTILQGKAVRIIDEIDEFSVKLMNLLNRMKYGVQTK
jgi:biopolymer transport protein ExbB/TolQ